VCFSAERQQVFWIREGKIIVVARTVWDQHIRLQPGSYDVVIDSATEGDQGMYECQALPSGVRDSTYLWVDGMLFC